MSEEHDAPEMSDDDIKGALARGALSVAGGALPVIGGFLSAVAGAWSEREQRKVNRAFLAWLRMLQDELREKESTIVEVMMRLDLHDEEISKRVESAEYQSLLRKAFREWGAVESEKKRVFIRNILTNAAADTPTSDDVVRLFLDWISMYSEFHFAVIAEIYKRPGITRFGMWTNLGRKTVREDSAEADLYKLLIRDLSTGGIIRQHRETDYYGNFIKKQTGGRRSGGGSREMKSAFDDEEEYELTQLGEQFVHYAMTDLPPKIAYTPADQPEEDQPA